jgi:uncharacterized protein YcfJ
MNMQAKLMIAALGLTALPLVHAVEFEDYGRVVRVQPRVEQVRMPRQECRTDYVQQPVHQAPQQGRSAGGAIIGGIAGALLGNQVGGGTGRAAATAAGAIAGAVVGDRVDNNDARAGNNYQQQQPVMQEQAVRQCRTVEAYESRTNGYEVTYDYRGRNYTTVLARDPGDRVRLHVSVEADPRQ